MARNKRRQLEIAPEARPILHYRQVRLKVLPMAKAVAAYNACKTTKAILLLLGEAGRADRAQASGRVRG